ncbi:hypothetical protein [Actinosynnema sp. NPDC020468]|uniref:hypothetical protein n=1 Tax=Actinosynnema sp. NPDC020468 TaxID=3154488 RepID=UPI0033FC092A
MRVLRLLVAALIEISVVVGFSAVEPTAHHEATRQQPLVKALTCAFADCEVGRADDVTSDEPAVALLRTTVRPAVAPSAGTTAVRVDTRVARGPPGRR